MLRRMGVYNRLRHSRIGDFYWSLTQPNRIIARDQEVAFYRTALSGFERSALIFDVGANIGEKVDVFLRMGASVVAVEPDPVCQLILAQKYHRLRLNACPVQLISNAVGSTDGVERMWVDGDGSALNTLSSKW